MPVFVNDLDLSNGAAFEDNTHNWGDANQTLTVHDRRVCFTAALTAARTIALPTIAAAAGRSFEIQDAAGGASQAHTVSLVPNGTDKINGVNANFLAINNAFGICRLYASLAGGNWIAMPVGYNATQFWQAAGTYTYPLPPANVYTIVRMLIYGGGGGGGGGGFAATGAISFGGGGGTSGGGLPIEWPMAAFIAKGDTSLTVVVGAGGPGGAARTTAGTGNTGTNGAATTVTGTQSGFVYAWASGGGAGAGATATVDGHGVSGQPNMLGFSASAPQPGAGASMTGTAGTTGVNWTNDARSVLPSGQGAGGGGGVTAANAVSNGGNGGGGHGWQGVATGNAQGGVGSTAANGGVGGTPTVPPAGYMGSGDTGAGGGSSNHTGSAGGAGGNGVANGGGGGGGGAGQGPATSSGAGGAGADGAAFFSAYGT